MAPTSTDPLHEAAPGYQVDVLGAPYQARTLTLQPDTEGEVVATLVHRPADSSPDLDRLGDRGAEAPTTRAVLHVHGFCDYFFCTPMADYWCARGYDFYALDLRKYGRSLRPHQTPNYIDDLATYGEELDLAYDAIRADHEQVVLSAHSTGGLTVPLWVADRRPEITGMVLNSPWLDFPGPALLRNVVLPVVGQVGSRRPRVEIPRTVDGIYGRSIHRDHQGEWDFNLAWKPLKSWPVYVGWLAAVRNGHHRVAQGLDIQAPILVLASGRSTKPKHIADPAVMTTDIVLDVNQIRQRAPMLGRHVTVSQVEGALHDVFLSAEPVRTMVTAEIDRFLSTYVEAVH